MSHKQFEILQLGHPALRKIAEQVINISESKTQKFLDQLLQFVIDKNGMGIAAPQVERSEKIFIMSSKPNARYPYAPDMEPTFVINPEILWTSPDIEKDWEGCLSIPGIRALVPRHQSIKVQFYSRHGEIIKAEYSGFIARIFQHEFDHLIGKVFLDRVESSQDIMMEQEWFKRVLS